MTQKSIDCHFAKDFGLRVISKKPKQYLWCCIKNLFLKIC